MITTVVFDLDDTLYDEIDYCRSGFGAVAEFVTNEAGMEDAEVIFDCLWKEFAAGNRTKTFNAAFDELGINYDDELIRTAVEVYRKHIPKITLPEDSENILSQLSEKYVLGLLTDGFLPAQKLKVEALGIEEYFKSIVYTEELGRDCWKPSTAGFEKLMDCLNVKRGNCVYVADNESKDFIAPNKLGFVTVQVIRSGRIHTGTSDQAGAAARYVIHKIGELAALLEKL